MGIDDTGDGDCLDLAEDRFGVDCDDTNAAISPRAVESCEDLIDNDCDLQIDLADSQCLCSATTDCNDDDPCTTDRCTTDMQDCEHVPDPFCGEAPDMGMVTPDGGVGPDGSISPPPPADEGCGCRVVGNPDSRSQSSRSGAGALVAFVLIALGAVRLARPRRSR
jgi:hypothetical protein